MKNFLLSLLAIFMMSSFVYANLGDGGGKNKKKEKSEVKKKIKEEERVDSFEIISETSGEDAGRVFCKITVNYYYQGHFVYQQSYTGHPCPLYGEFNCKKWKEGVLDTINFWLDHYETGPPAGTDMSC